MKKNDFYYEASLLTGIIFLVVMPLSVFLLIEILMVFLGYTEAKLFLKDHGSLVVGLVTAVVAVITIIFHSKYAREQIAESRRLSIESRFIEKREAVLMRLSRVRGKLDKFREAAYVAKNKEWRDSLSIEIRDDLLEISTIAHSYDISYKDELYALSEIANILYYSLLYHDSFLEGDTIGWLRVSHADIENLVSIVIASPRLPRLIEKNIFIPLLKSLVDGREHEDRVIAEWLVSNLYGAICSIRGDIFFNISSQSSQQALLPEFKIRDDEFLK